MIEKVIYLSKNKEEWDNILKKLNDYEPSFSSEFYDLYLSSYPDSSAAMWVFKDKEKIFSYSFLMTKIDIISNNKKLFWDISSTYGCLGPLCNTTDEGFIKKSWEQFYLWCNKNNIVVEFIRFNPIYNNHLYASKKINVAYNRKIAITILDKDFEKNYSPKSKNLARKAIKNSLRFRVVELKDYKDEFYEIYSDTMKRNKAKQFFLYDKNYFDKLSKIKNTILCGTFMQKKTEELVAAGVFLTKNKRAIYHLGACKKEYLNLGASNLYMYMGSKYLKEKNFLTINLGGGRSVELNDTLLKFKKNNSTHLKDFFIGKNIIDITSYENIKKKTGKLHDLNKLIFYREN